MHDMPHHYAPTPAPDQAAMRADLLHRALEETGKLSTALDLAERAWHFIHPWSVTAAMVADLKASIWDAPMETEPAMPPPSATPAAPIPATPAGATDGRGTQVVVDPPPENVATEPAASAPAPPAPIPQTHRPAAAPRVRNTSPQAPKAWTSEEEAALQRMYNEGSSDTAIALALGRTQKAVSIRCAKLGLSKARHGKEGGGDGG